MQQSTSKQEVNAMGLDEVLTQRRIEPAVALVHALDKVIAQLAHMPEVERRHK